jgi:hypothetical protein
MDFFLARNDPASKTYPEFVQNLRENMQTAFDTVHQHLMQKFDHMKVRYDKRIRQVQFRPGDLVWYFSPRYRPGKGRKWQMRSRGPMLVIEQINLVNFRLQETENSEPFLTHIDKMSKFKGEPSNRMQKWVEKWKNRNSTNSERPKRESNPRPSDSTVNTKNKSTASSSDKNNDAGLKQNGKARDGMGTFPGHQPKTGMLDTNNRGQRSNNNNRLRTQNHTAAHRQPNQILGTDLAPGRGRPARLRQPPQRYL